MKELDKQGVYNYNVDRINDLASAYQSLRDIDEMRINQQGHPTLYQDEYDGQVIEIPLDFEMEKMIEGGINGLARQLYHDRAISKDIYHGYIFKRF